MHEYVRVQTVQGIGDIFWVYQKLAPLFANIDLDILTVADGPVQHRSAAFCQMLPQVRAVNFVRVSSSHYHAIAGRRFSVSDLQVPGPTPYACNAPLEKGVNLLELDPGLPVQPFVDLGLPAFEPRQGYLCVFVAGAKNGIVWPALSWIPVIVKLAERLQTRRIKLIGAQWDIEVQNEILEGLRPHRFDLTSYVGNTGLADTIRIIRRSRFFLGYQSGLNIIAENYNVPQLMIYFAMLRPMLYTWCKPASVRTQFYATTFADDVVAFIDEIGVDALRMHPGAST